MVERTQCCDPCWQRHLLQMFQKRWDGFRIQNGEEVKRQEDNKMGDQRSVFTRSISLVLLALLLCFGMAAAEDTVMLGEPFPDFTVIDTQGNAFTLSEALKDHEAVLINIWATWCPPCEAEMPTGTDLSMGITKVFQGVGQGPSCGMETGSLPRRPVI